ncbi:MAG: GldG family protein [Bdellovibrionales bacterium]|nr:GldG family protein [Bdellovibrionales bacterium]
MKLGRVASYLFLGSLFAVVVVWGYLPRVWLMGWPQLALLGLSAAGLVGWFVFSLDDLRQWLKKRSTQFALSLVVMAIMSVLLLASVNWLASTYNVKRDVTRNKLHTLSDQTKSIAAGLKENITIRVWSSAVERMAANVDMKRFLENYELASKGKIKVEIKNPIEDAPGAKADAVKRDNVIIVRSASGRESRVESFNDSKGEELITNAIVQAIKGQKKMVCFVSGHGELSLGDSDAQGLSILKSNLSDSSYEVREVLLATSEKLPADCEAIVVVGPRSEAVEREMKMLHAYLAQGGKMLALLGPGTPAGWRKFANEYGVNVRSDLIIDPRVKPPFAIATKNYAQDVDMVKSLGSRIVIFPETSSIDVASKPRDGETVKTFISSENYTFAKTGDLKNVTTIRMLGTDLRGPLPVAVLVQKTIHAAAAPDKPMPVKPGKPAAKEGKAPSAFQRVLGISSAYAQGVDDDADEHMPAESVPGAVPTPAKDGPKDTKTEMSLIVLSNHNFAMNSFVTQVGNMDLFLNSINYLLKDQDLMGIRPREISQAALELTNENLRQVYATVLLLAGGFLFGGILAKRRKSIFEE